MKILISGGNGLVGKTLTAELQREGYEVAWLVRKTGAFANVKQFKWNPASGFIDHDAVAWSDVIIHLAGAPVAEKKWTEERKREIISSRVSSSRLLASELKRNDKPRVVIAASAVGYYGMRTSDTVFRETDPSHDDFFGECCRMWEESEREMQTEHVRLVQFRIGIVLSSEGGALPKMSAPVRWGVGAPLGSGHQWMPWIHMNDLVGMMIFALKNEKVQGVFNAVAPNPVTNRELTSLMGKVLSRPVWMPAVPAWTLKMALGEMAGMVLEGSRVSSEKIRQKGYQFHFTDAETALKDLL